jgi:hypothetical protein
MSFRRITFSNGPDACGCEYSTCTPFNCDSSRLLLLRSNRPSILDHFGLFDGAGAFLEDLSIGASDEPRWHRTKPNILYYHAGSALIEYDAVTGQKTTRRTFTEYVSIYAHGKSDISWDGDHFVFIGTKQDASVEVFVYTISTDTKSQPIPQALPFNSVCLTPDNQVLIFRNTSDPPRPTDGIYLLRPDGGEFQLTKTNEHAGVCTYQGRSKLLWAQDDTINALTMVDVGTAERAVLRSYDWRYAMHITVPINQPWCVPTLDCPTKDLPSIVERVYFDTSIQPELLCADTKTVFNGYQSEVKGAISNVMADGTSKLVGCSNFGLTTDEFYSDVFMLDIPPAVQVGPAQPVQTPIDYSIYAGKSEFVIQPQPKCGTCGSTIAGIIERKL